MTKPTFKKRSKSLLTTALLVLFGVLVNVLLERLFKPLGLPVYMDTLGTVLVSLLGGSLPGVFAAALTTVIRGAAFSWMHIYFGVINVFLAVLVSWFKTRACSRASGRPSSLFCSFPFSAAP